jgi:hypothetical protein
MKSWETFALFVESYDTPKALAVRSMKLSILKLRENGATLLELRMDS